MAIWEERIQEENTARMMPHNYKEREFHRRRRSPSHVPMSHVKGR